MVKLGFVLPVLSVLAGAAGLALAEPPPEQTALRMPAGYLQPGQMPDSIALVPPPPAEGSKQLKRDRKAEARALAQHGNPRWDLARADADVFTPRATSALSCAAGFAIGPQTTPRLDALLRKTLPDFGMVSAAAKTRYDRARPFEVNGRPVCTPEYEPMLRGNGSYPSGHATIGYGWALVLAEVLPRRRSQLLARGRDFADSRRVCNVHYRSDVEIGMALAAPVFERLRADPVFQADLAAARVEVKALRSAKPDCKAEAAALRLR
jgi:acid phosphatase (class A)